MIKIDFEYDTNYGVFRDALYLPENHGMSAIEIEQTKQNRLNKWIQAITNPPSVEEQPPVLDDNFIIIANETYEKLMGVPPSGAKLIEINNIWYFKV